MSESSLGARAPTWWLSALHLVALSSFAIAWPLFDRLSRATLFFVARGSTGRDLILFAFALVLIPPALMTAVVLVVRMLSVRLANVVQAAFVGILFTLILSPALTKAGLQVATNVRYPLIAIVATVAYMLLPLAQRAATFLTPAPLVFIVLFLGFSPVTAFFGTPAPVQAQVRVKPPSLAFLLLDEFSSSSIRKPDGSINAKRFPNFARLAERSTWYPNATTNSNMTRLALPSILTGRYPKTRGDNAVPMAKEYPENLFALLEGTHRLRVNEWVSGLCGQDACNDQRRESTGLKDLVGDTTLTFAISSLPPVLADRLPRPGLVLRLLADPVLVDANVERFPRFARPLVRVFFEFFADDDSALFDLRRFDRFLSSIEKTAKPTAWFMHAAYPHVPWILLPDLRVYDDQALHGITPDGVWITNSATDEALQRYLFQLKATDTLVGRFIDKLDDEDAWEDTMVVVQADHGVAFTKDRGTRAIEGAEAETLPIPLFIKFPGQRSGVVDDRNAELIDIAPTISDALGIDIPWNVDGTSLRSKDPRSRLMRVWDDGAPLTPFSAAPDPTAPSERIEELFGTFGGADDLYAWGPHRDLVGRRLSRLDIDGEVVGLTLERPDRYAAVDADAQNVPARISGELAEGARWTWIAVAVNGRVAGLARPDRRGQAWGFSAIVRPDSFEARGNDITVVGIDARGKLAELRG